jgi:hypothetical protein
LTTPQGLRREIAADIDQEKCIMRLERASAVTRLCQILALVGLAAASSNAQLVAPPVGGQPEPTPAPAVEPGKPATRTGPEGPRTPNVPAEPSMLVQQRAKMIFESQHHDFGKIVDVEQAEAVFKFTNKGNEVLKIVDKKATCGCTVPDLAKSEYQPGESGEIKVTYNPRGKHGSQTQTVTITTNDPIEPKVQLTIGAQVQPLVSIEPAVVQFGQVNKHAPKTIKVVVTGRTPDFKVTDATLSDSAKMSVKVLASEPIDVDGTPGARTTLELTLPETHPVGRIAQTGTIRTNESRREVMNFTVMGEVLGDLGANPARIAFGNIKPASEFRGELKLVNRVGKPFKILSAKADAPIDQPLTVKITPDSQSGATEYTVEVSGVAPAKTMLLRGELVITTDVADETEVRLPFWGTVRATN